MNKLTSTWKQRRSSATSNKCKLKEDELKKPSKNPNNVLISTNAFPSLYKKGLRDENATKPTVKQGNDVPKIDQAATSNGLASEETLDDSYPLSSFEWSEGDLKALENVDSNPVKSTYIKNISKNSHNITQHNKSFNSTHQSTPYILRNSKAKLTNILSPVLPLNISSYKNKSLKVSPKAENCSLLIENWGLPSAVVKQYKEKGIKEMFQWQVDCLRTGNVLNGDNLVYSAPTSAGKTLVAEILMLKRVIETKRKAIYILPFVSVTREKVHALKTVFQDINITVEGFMGSQAPVKGFTGCDIAVCTIEKANSLVNRLIEDKTIFSIGCVIIDELHMLGDSSRGYLLELMLTKLLYISMSSTIKSSCESLSQENNHIQIIGMSATLPNLSLIASWLRADLYITTYRPVELVESIKVGPSLLDSNGKLTSTMKSSTAKRDEEGLIDLCHETVHEGNSVLVFCPTKNWCEKLCEVIGTGLMSFTGDKKVNLNHEAVNEILGQLQRSQVGLDPYICACIKHGVAYHHAGLTFDERDIIEDAFRRGTIKVLIATLTLSSGVNLPARRVIIRTPMFHGNVLNPRVYKQMAGRAGRKGVDDKGESVLICKPSEKQNGLRLLSAELSPVLSCLLRTEQQTVVDNDSFPELKRALLEIICSGAASSYKDAQTYASCTFLKTCLENEKERKTFENALEATFKYLIDNEFLRNAITDESKLPNRKTNELDVESISQVEPTQLGMATLASALAPKEALIVLAELRKARKCFVLENELHIIYQVTPINNQDQWSNLDWYKFYTIWERLPSDHKTVGHLVGVEESYLTRALHGRVPTRTEDNRIALGIHRRFFTALALQDLVNEVPLVTVSRKYGVNRGMLQSLQTSAATFAGMVTKFCQKLGWCNLELILAQFQSRLSLGINRQLCDLARVTSLNGTLARLLYNAGYHTVCLLAAADVNQIEKILRESSPFESKQNQIYSKNHDRFLFISGRRGLTERQASDIILKEAKDIINAEIAKLGGKPSTTLQPSSASKKSKRTRNRKGQSIISRQKRLSRKRQASDSGSCSSAKRSSATTTTSASSDSSTSPLTKETDHPLVVPDDVVRIDNHVITTANEVGYSLAKEAANEDPLDHEDGVKSDNHATEDSTLSNATSNTSDLICASQVSVPSTSMLSMTKQIDCVSSDESNANDSTKSSFQLSDVALFDDQVEPISPSSSTTVDPQESPETCFDPLEKDSMSSSPSPRTTKKSPKACFDLLVNGSIPVANNRPTQSRLSFNDSEPSVSLLMAVDDLESKVIPQLPIQTPLRESKKEKSERSTEKQNLRSHRKHMKVEIIDIDDKVFKTLLNELKSQEIVAVSLGCESILNKSSIGAIESRNEKSYLYQCTNENEIVTSLTICWGSLKVYHFNLKHLVADKQNKIVKDRLQSIMDCIVNSTTILYDFIHQYKLFNDILRINLIGQFEDPKVADWLLDQDKDSCSFQQLCQQHLNQTECNLLSRFGKSLDTKGLGNATQLRGSGRSRSATEAALTYELMNVLHTKLNAIGLTRSFKEVEMPTNAILAKMHCIGIGMSASECSRIENVLVTRLHTLESECYEKSGQRFSLNSPDEVSRVLFVHLKLPNDCEVGNNGRRSLRSGVRHLSTNKVVLEKLADVHELPRLIIQWRKINNTLIKVIKPLLRLCCQSNESEHAKYKRIYPQPQFRTATGRISFCEPNLQSIPRDFDIELPCDSVKDTCISLRTAFIPHEGYVFISADYCQMELRIIAHLANDRLLLRILSDRHGDVFKTIAAETNNIDVNDVSNELRQRAKQMCYGIIYGMGRKLLAEQLGVDEKSAGVYINRFKSRFLRVNKYVEETIRFAQINGYVTTLSGRRRFLKSIHSRNNSGKAQGERQAVNTTVQGSAADLVKSAMIGIEKQLKTSLLSSKAFIVLQLHDELMYEVDVNHVDAVSRIIRREMENAIPLNVITPVKLRIGKSWGELTETTVNDVRLL